jgi:hypothetical protein
MIDDHAGLTEPTATRRLVRIASHSWLLALALSTGCGGSGNVPASGRVVFSDQQPVRSGKVEVRAASGNARGIGTIDNEGHFSLKGDDQRDGVPPGDYDAVVVQFIVAEDLSVADHNHGRPVPRRYADYYTSQLRVTVPENGTDKLLIEIEPK